VIVTHAVAIFAEGTYEVTDQLSTIAGVRGRSEETPRTRSRASTMESPPPIRAVPLARQQLLRRYTMYREDTKITDK
jgi:hypothetical protein